jgi:hypothetical protein
VPVTITIPNYDALSQNMFDRMHWTSKQAAMRYAKFLTRNAVFADVSDNPQPFAVPVHLTITAYRARRLDSDNVWVKGVIDGLVWAGLLHDDSPRYVASTRTLCEKSGEEPYVTIQITTEEA